MKDGGLGGRIINISSIGAQNIGDALSHPNAPYHAAKAALDHFSFREQQEISIKKIY